MALKKIVYPKSLKDIPLWRQRQLAEDLLWFSKFSPVERLPYIDREWEEIQTFINKFGLKTDETRKEVKFVDLIRSFNRHKIRYLIVGRRAIILYGAPVLTADHDLWIHPTDKKRTLSLLSEQLNFELSDDPDTRKPIVSAFSGMKKFANFFLDKKNVCGIFHNAL